jgi:hypothetical protein
MRKEAGSKESSPLRPLMNTKRGGKALFNYLKETQIATRKWFLEETDLIVNHRS